MSERRLRVFSGIQPSGVSHIGNYLGAIRNWVDQQELYDNVFCIVNLHALSLPTTRDTLRANTVTMANTLLAAGIDPKQSILFVQSDVREHAELCWLLNSVTQFGELRRMTQFKDKTGGQDEAVSAALFDYPVLQAADILLYDTDLVPVGDDQKQHVELTRDIAERFNARYGETFVLPQADIKPEGARIMGLDDPTKKMSKSSASPNSYIAFGDDAGTITRKIKRAVTDSGGEVRAGGGQAGGDQPARHLFPLQRHPGGRARTGLRRKRLRRVQGRSRRAGRRRPRSHPGAVCGARSRPEHRAGACSKPAPSRREPSQARKWRWCATGSGSNSRRTRQGDLQRALP